MICTVPVEFRLSTRLSLPLPVPARSTLSTTSVSCEHELPLPLLALPPGGGSSPDLRGSPASAACVSRGDISVSLLE